MSYGIPVDHGTIEAITNSFFRGLVFLNIIMNPVNLFNFQRNQFAALTASSNPNKAAHASPAMEIPVTRYRTHSSAYVRL